VCVVRVRPFARHAQVVLDPWAAVTLAIPTQIQGHGRRESTGGRVDSQGLPSPYKNWNVEANKVAV